jgi:hypothetical protein
MQACKPCLLDAALQFRSASQHACIIQWLRYVGITSWRALPFTWALHVLLRQPGEVESQVFIQPNNSMRQALWVIFHYFNKTVAIQKRTQETHSLICTKAGVCDKLIG